jgi:hypothetical protein
MGQLQLQSLKLAGITEPPFNPFLFAPLSNIISILHWQLIADIDYLSTKNRQRDIAATSKSIQTSSQRKATKNQIRIPTLVTNLVVAVLKELGVRVAMAFFEADAVIAEVAKQMSCTVISNDSDFYIYDVPMGYIATTSLQNTR